MSFEEDKIDLESRLSEHLASFRITSSNSPLNLENAKKQFNEKLEELFKKKSETIKISENKIGQFTVVKTLGSGSFGRVVLVKIDEKECKDYVPEQNICNGFKYYSVKIMQKKQLIHHNQLEHVLNERRLMGSLTHPFIVHLVNCYKDNSQLFLQMEFVSGGEMFTHLRKSRRFNESIARFFASQVLLAFEYLHHLQILYRDLKPENIMLNDDGYIKVTDFGFAKKVDGRTWTLCGTPEYLAPEIILNKGYTKTVDWWAFGVLIYEMCAGFPPFCDSSPMRIYEKILTGKIKYLPFFSQSLREILSDLLHMNVTRRLGNLNGGVDDIKRHEWFDDHIDWCSIFFKEVKPSYSILHKPPEFTINFDKYEEEDIYSSIECLFEEEFIDF